MITQTMDVTGLIIGGVVGWICILVVICLLVAWARS